jgi:putative membrane protein
VTDRVEALSGTDAPVVTMQRLHGASILFHWFALLRSGLFPLVLVALQSRTRGGNWLLYGVGGLLAVFAVGSLARFLFTRYGLGADAFHFRSGVLARQSRVIPYDRIQSVNVRQSALQRLLRMGELHVETATQGISAEVVLRVLRWRDAQALREHLVAERRGALADRRTVTDDTVASGAADASGTRADAEARASVPASVIATLDVEQLMIAGGTSNNVGVLLAVLFSGFDRLRSSFFDDLDLTGGLLVSLDSVTAAVGASWALALFVLLVLVPLVVASWMVSVAGSVVRYHGFTLERVGRDLRRSHGLFSRVEASVPLRRAQAVRFHESLLRRPFGLGELWLVSAGSAGGGAGGAGAGGGMQVLLPILRRAQVSNYVPVVFPEASLGEVLSAPPDDVVWTRPRPVAALRIAMSSTVRVGVLLALIAVVIPDWLGTAAWLLPLGWGLAWLRRRARGIAVVDGHVLVREGGLARTLVILPEAKLQLIEVRQGPLQRLFDVATLRLTTAGIGGDADMVDLDLAEARSLQDDLTARLPRAVRRVVTPATAPATTIFDSPTSEERSDGA